MADGRRDVSHGARPLRFSSSSPPARQVQDAEWLLKGEKLTDGEKKYMDLERQLFDVAKRRMEELSVASCVDTGHALHSSRVSHDRSSSLIRQE